jgi:Family of unknown function (DUF5681)
MRDGQQQNGTGERPWLWRKGQSGNPAGRPKGARNKATLLLEELLSGEEVERLAKLLYARALAGNGAALRFLLSRLLPPARHPRVAFDLPASTGNPDQDAAAALEALVRAVAAGELAPAEAKPLAGYIERARRFKGAAPVKESAPAKRPAAPAPAAAPSVFPSVLSAPPPGSRRDTLLAGTAALPSARLDAIRPRVAA